MYIQRLDQTYSVHAPRDVPDSSRANALIIALGMSESGDCNACTIHEIGILQFR